MVLDLRVSEIGKVALIGLLYESPAARRKDNRVCLLYTYVALS